MTIKFFKRNRASIAYLLNNPTAKVLEGSAAITERIIQSLGFKQADCSGCLSFNEILSHDKRMQHIREFDSLIGAGVPSESLNKFWVHHQDKGRDELHFKYPQADLKTGRQWTIYLDWRDRDLVNAFRDTVNIREGYTCPDDSKRKKMASVPFRVSATKKEFIQQIGEAVARQVEGGNILNRDQVVIFLEQQGLEVKRGKRSQLPTEYLKVKRKDDEIFTGLRGAFYRADFTSPSALTSQPSVDLSRETLRQAEEKLANGIEQRAFRQARRHESALRVLARRETPTTADAELKSVLPHFETNSPNLKPSPQSNIADTTPQQADYETKRTTNPFSGIVGRAGESASARGKFIDRTIENIGRLFTDFFRAEPAAPGATNEAGRVGEAISGCCDLLQRSVESLGRAVGGLAAAIRQRELNQGVAAHLDREKHQVAPSSPDVFVLKNGLPHIHG